MHAASNRRGIEPPTCVHAVRKRIIETMPFDSVRKVADADFPTRWGQFRILGFEGVVTNPEPCNEAMPAPATRIESAVALVMGDIHAAPPIVRIHSQCLTGDVFHSLRCDCRQQLELALATIADAGAGILLYEKQEGRGIGLMAKLRPTNCRTRDGTRSRRTWNWAIDADCREYELPAEMLKMLGVKAVRLITNNPEKVEALEAAGIEVAERISARGADGTDASSATCRPSARRWGIWSAKGCCICSSLKPKRGLTCDRNSVIFKERGGAAR